jgi:hypothetical protein
MGFVPLVAPERGGRPRGLRLILLAPLALGACQNGFSPAPGTPEGSAAIVSRAYDCGLRVERGRVVRSFSGEERRRFVDANAAFAVRSYNAPRPCTEAERAVVASALLAAQRR